MTSAKPKNCIEDEVHIYTNQIKDIPLLTFDDEVSLSKLIQQGNKEARKRLIEANLRLVIKIAKSYYAYDVSLMDLIQEGNMGLMQAADRFDFNRNVRFSTYAGWWIRQAIGRFLTNKRRTIRLPSRKEEILRKIQFAYHTLSQQHSRQPKRNEVAMEIGVSVKEIDSVLNLTNGFSPFEMEITNEEGTTVVNMHEDYTYSPERSLIARSLREETKSILKKRLKKRERHVLMYHYQLNGSECHTLKNIGDRMGISPETVRQIEMRAMKKIRSDVEDLHIYYAYG